MSEPMDEKLIQKVADAIATVDTRPDLNISDNVAIMIVSAYEDDNDCPDEGEPGGEVDEDRSSWKVWALDQEEALRRRMAIAAIKAYDKAQSKA